MVSGALDTILIPSLRLEEIATDGSTLSNPAADSRRLFLGEDGALHLRDSAGTITAVANATGAVATDPIWATAGDIAIATANDAAGVLPAGAAGTVLTGVAAGSAPVYALPPGHEFDYVEYTAPVSPTATTEDTADTVVTGSSVAYNGSTVVMIEFWALYSRPDSTAASRQLKFYLYEDGSSIGRIGLQVGPAALGDSKPIWLRRRMTPTNASHTYSIRAAVDAGTGLIGAGAGGHAADMPGYIRITRV